MARGRPRQGRSRVRPLHPQRPGARGRARPHPRRLPFDEIDSADCRHPDLDADLAAVYEAVVRGRGLAILRGVPVTEHPIDDVERIYWAIIGHFGRQLSQNSLGHRMVRVQEEVLPNGVQPARGTKSRAELAMHNDAGDVFGLLSCTRPPAAGRASSPAVPPRTT